MENKIHQKNPQGIKEKRIQKTTQNQLSTKHSKGKKDRSKKVSNKVSLFIIFIFLSPGD